MAVTIPDKATAFTLGTSPPGGDDDWMKPRAETLLSGSVFNPQGYREVFDNPRHGPGVKASYVAGRLAGDALGDGLRRTIWLSNHPLAQLGLVSEYPAIHSGLAPDYPALAAEIRKQDPDANLNSTVLDDVHAERMGLATPRVHNRGVPLDIARYAIPAMATAAMVQSSGNFDAGNLLSGGRAPGYEAIIPVAGDPSRSASPPLELAARYLFGRTGRLLPWDQFHQERPEIAKSDYLAYKAHQFDGGLLDLGLIKGTGRNLEGEPEMTMMGFRVPLSAAGAALGSMAAAVGGAKAADHFLADRFPAGTPAALGLERPGHRRLAGAALGALAGALLGRGVTKAANDAILQPIFNPDAVAAAQLSRLDPDAYAGLLQQQRALEEVQAAAGVMPANP